MVDMKSRKIQIMMHEENKTVAVLQLPLVLAYAKELSKRSVDEVFTAPFVKHELVAGRTYYRLDTTEAKNNPKKFISFLLRDIEFEINDKVVKPTEHKFFIVDTHREQNSSDSKAITNIGPDLLLFEDQKMPIDPYIVGTLAIASFILPETEKADNIAVKLLSPSFRVPEGKYFSTEIIDKRSSRPIVFSFKGLTFPQVTLSGSHMESFWHFVQQGMYHILIGFDHILFVLCLGLAAVSPTALFWSVTGFTIGHSASLAAGTLGFVLNTTWFIPAIEFLVAFSIVIMATLVILKKRGSVGFWMATALGVLHGFGFSFMLMNMIGSYDASPIVPLLGFNIGVEIGQLAIVATLFLLLFLVNIFARKLTRFLRYGIVMFAFVSAAVMLFDRGAILVKLFDISQKTVL